MPSFRQILAALDMHVSRLRASYASALGVFLVASIVLWQVVIAAPANFPAGHVITIQNGATVSDVAEQLQAAGIIDSALNFKVLSKLRGGGVKSGKYVFAKPVGLWRVEERVSDAAYGITATRVTFVEGETSKEMARQLKKAFPDFDDAAFMDEASSLEGFLFPDTYLFYPDVTAHEVIVRLYSNFSEHEEEIMPQITAFDAPLRDDIIMASILEKEARTLAEKRMVAGILWNRIKNGMPLQVDAVFGYINDRPTYSPTLEELKIDSPYNTYTHPGLPPGPIGNPGAASLLAAVTPATTTALYYLTGRDGVMHYAKTFAEHKLNRARYLD